MAKEDISTIKIAKVRSLTQVTKIAPILSSAKAVWNGIFVEKYYHPPLETPPLSYSSDTVILQLSGAVEIERRTNRHLHSNTFVGNDVGIFPANLLHAGRVPENSLHLAIRLEPSLLAHAASACFCGDGVELVPQFAVHDAQIQYIGLALLAELEAGCVAGRLYGDSLSVALAVHLLRKYSTAKPVIHEFTGGLTPGKLRCVIDFINDNLADELRLKEMAEVVGMSEYRFARLFKQSTGMTPHQYVIKQRIEQAKRLLANTELTVAEVAYRVGFTTQSRFTIQFGRNVGTTPTAYRKAFTS